jgi:hypothetical protein
MVLKSCWKGGEQVKLRRQMGYWSAGIGSPLLDWWIRVVVVARKRGVRRRVRRRGRIGVC